MVQFYPLEALKLSQSFGGRLVYIAFITTKLAPRLTLVLQYSNTAFRRQYLFIHILYCNLYFKCDPSLIII